MPWSPRSTNNFPPPSPAWGDALPGVMGREGLGRAARCRVRPEEGTRRLSGPGEDECHRGKAGWGRAAGSAPRTQPSRSSTASEALAPRLPASLVPLALPSPSPLGRLRSDGVGVCLLFALSFGAEIPQSRGGERGERGPGQAASAAGVSGARCPMARPLRTQVRLGVAVGPRGGSGCGVAGGEALG